MAVTAPAQTDNRQQNQPRVLNAFTRAAKEHVENFFDQAGIVTVASAKPIGGSIEVTAFGYLRAVLVTVIASGGAASGTNAVMKADAPWSAISSIQVNDSNGNPFFGPVTGYEAYLISKWSGSSFYSDPTLSPDYSAPTTGGNFAFTLRLPIEGTARDGLGSLPNMDGQSPYKVNVSIADTASIYATAPGTVPTFEIILDQECWTDPPAADALGNPNETEPPAAGTLFAWSADDINVSAGNQTPKLTRVGNTIRELILVTRNVSGVRVDTMLPDPLTFTWDGRQLTILRKALLKRYNYERSGLAQDTGVYVIEFAHDLDGKIGDELRDGYLPTSSATLLRLEGSYGVAGTMRVLTNDVLAFVDPTTVGQ